MTPNTWKECITRLGGLTPAPEEGFVPVSNEEIEAIEIKFAAKLPNDYREFLATYGSSRFVRMVSIRSGGPLPRSQSEDGMLPFGGFYGSEKIAGEYPTVLSCADNFHGDIPDDLLPIGNGWEDDQICLGLAGALRGKIFYWDSQGVVDANEGDEAISNPVRRDFRDTHYIADSFTDLLNRMEHSMSDDDE